MKATLSLGTMDAMEPEPLVSREEAQAMLFAIADLNVNVERIMRLLEENFEEGPEEDA